MVALLIERKKIHTILDKTLKNVKRKLRYGHFQACTYIDIYKVGRIVD